MATVWTQTGSYTEGATTILTQRGVDSVTNEQRGYRLVIDAAAQTAVAHGRIARGVNVGGDVYLYASAETIRRSDPAAALPTGPFKVTLST